MTTKTEKQIMCLRRLTNALMVATKHRPKLARRIMAPHKLAEDCLFPVQRGEWSDDMGEHLVKMAIKTQKKRLALIKGD